MINASDQEELNERKKLESLINPTYQVLQEKFKNFGNPKYQHQRKASKDQRKPLSDQILALKTEIIRGQLHDILETDQVFKTSARPRHKSEEVDRRTFQIQDKNRSKSDTQEPKYEDLVVPYEAPDYTQLKF